jgi:flagellar hook-length control protein FliK
MNPLSNASSLNAERARLDTARPTAAPADAPGGGFAQLLQGARDAGAAPKPAEPARDERSAARTEAKGQDDPAAKAPEAERAQDSEASDETEATDRPERSRETGPTLAHWLLNGGAPPAEAATAAAAAAMPPAQQPAAPTDDLKAAAMAREVLDAVRQRARAGAGGKGAEGAPATTAADAALRRGDTAKAAPQAAADTAAGLSGAGEAPREIPQDRSQGGEPRFADALGHAAAQAGAAPAPLVNGAEAGTPAAAAPVDPRVDTPVHDAGFGSAVGVTISRLAKEGLHQASLQLNPAELGPVAVRIEMQGQEARLSLSAAHAETRALLDASLPALTEAFRADGLVLAASEVSDMGREQGSAFAGQGGAGAQAQSDAGARGQGHGGSGASRGDGRPGGGEAAGAASRVTQITMPVPAGGPGRTRGGAAGALDLYA